MNERQLAHVFDTFHAGWDYTAGLQATLKFFRKLGRGATD